MISTTLKKRCLAFIIDLIYNISIYRFWLSDFSSIIRLIIMIVSLIVVLIFYARSSSPGKYIMELIVVVPAKNNAPCSLGRMLFREVIGKAISGFSFYLGYLLVFFSKQELAFHDLIAGTKVIEKKPTIDILIK